MKLIIRILLIAFIISLYIFSGYLIALGNSYTIINGPIGMNMYSIGNIIGFIILCITHFIVAANARQNLLVNISLFIYGICLLAFSKYINEISRNSSQGIFSDADKPDDLSTTLFAVSSFYIIIESCIKIMKSHKLFYPQNSSDIG